MRIQNLQPHRRGITLLFVVSMIVLFMLLATTFLVISSQYLRGARSYSKSEIFESEPQKELDQVLYMLLRDTQDPNNPMRGHSLLADVYGYNQTIIGNVRANTAQYVTNSEDSIVQLILENGAFDTAKNSHLGQLLTFTNGGMQGVTCRIVGHVFDLNTGFHYFRVFPLLDNFYTDATSVLDALNLGPEFIINGRPFSGTGAGYVAGDYSAADSFQAGLAAGALTAEALDPNQSGTADAAFRAAYIGLGDVNEDYDAADYQNVFLAAEIPAIVGGVYMPTIIPSFHRPALASSEGATADTMFRPLPAGNPNFPALTGFGVSTATTALDAMVNGDRVFDWDVDNDKDRVNDSVWIDPNLPVVTDSSGRTYKRMFAILCKDMDGRFNMNAHSHRWHQDGLFDDDVVQSLVALEQRDPTSGALRTASTLTPSVTDATKPALPIGVGMGPAEINMRPIFNTVAENLDFQRLMYGDNTNNIWGRNGRDFGFTVQPEPGFLFADSIDLNTTLRYSDFPIGLPHFSGAYGSYADIQGRLGFGVDYQGQPVYSLTTLAGTELHENQYERNLNQSSLNGYSKVTNRGGDIANHQKDTPFSYAEIERILRGNDHDALSLPTRITDLAPNTFNLGTNAAQVAQTLYARANFGGHSFDIPSIPTDIVDELRQLLTTVGGLNGVALEESLEEMLPAEFFLHQKFDINRMFGDGLDDARGSAGDADTVVDNHWGSWSPDLVPAVRARIDESILNETDAAGQTLDLDNDGLVGTADTDEHLVRYKYARTLYVLMRTILYTSGVETSPANIEKVTGPGADLDGNGTAGEVNDLAVFVAQWAINVVDFRDKDSIMTPFEFDLNPFNGWNVDGNPLFADVWRDGLNNPIDIGGGTTLPEADRFVVFGCERPNLLMTETLAFHDRRTEDRDDEDPNGGDAETKADGDTDSDQRLKPEGSLFIELFNPQNLSTARTSDVYDNNGGNNISNNNGFNLGRTSTTLGVSDTAGTIAGKAAPVWRIVMTTTDIDLDVGTATQRNTLRRDNVERVMYFVFEDNGDGTTDPGEYQRSELQYELNARVLVTNGMFLLPENVYKNHLSSMTGISSAVIGTAQFQVGTTETYIAPLGRRTDAIDETTDVKYDQTRSIIMTPGAGAGAVVVRDLDAAGSVVNYSKGTLGIPFLNLNISEPLGGYTLGAGRSLVNVTTTDAAGTQYTEQGFTDGMDVYVFDEPLDIGGRPNGGNNSLDNFANFFNANNTTQRGYRVLHLQRLANPLVGWHPETNPYLTVDTMPVDLSVFDGVSSGDLGAFQSGEGFGTRERGESEGVNRNLWRVEPFTNIQTAQAAAGDNHRFSFYLENPNTANVEEESLGHTKLGAADQINHVFDLLNNPDYTTTGATPTYPWLAWHNRPFVNQYEMMLVPHTSSSQLLRDFTDDSQPGNPVYGDAAQSLVGGFGHLINFFQGSQGPAALGPDFCRVFDFVHVPSQFAGTRSYLNNGATTFGSVNGPDLFLDLDEAQSNADSTQFIDGNDSGFSAPANFLSKQREPGKINMNTVFTTEIWEGLNGGAFGSGGHSVADWGQFINSRRGASPGTIVGPIPGPTYFPSPYRSSNAGNLIPPTLTTRTPANTGMMRQAPAPLPPNPLLDTVVGTVNLNRHAALKYQTRARLGNLTTNRSNVFGVWITVGYFEVDEATGAIGQEIGTDTGDIVRHRSFYMIDRSIPVGFEPGKNHNVDKTIMLKRYIE